MGRAGRGGGFNMNIINSDNFYSMNQKQEIGSGENISELSRKLPARRQADVLRVNKTHQVTSQSSMGGHTNKSDQKMVDNLFGSNSKLDNPPSHMTPEAESLMIQRLMQLEGQCKIRDWEFIKFSKCQAVFAMMLIILSVVGLFFLKYSAWFRRKAFFSDCSQTEATHLYITSNDKKNDIVAVLRPGEYPFQFYYKQLKYSITSINKARPTPVAFEFEREFEQCFTLNKLKKGLTEDEVKRRTEAYGLNEHLVKTPLYPEYLLDVMTEPFFILQYFFCFMFFVQGYAPFAIALLFFSFLTTTINYIMLYISYKKIKQIALRSQEVKVIRDGQTQSINCNQMVPGDVFIPDENSEVPADCIVGLGDIYVNEANLTGENFPIGKFRIESIDDIDNSNVWIYEGSKILETKAGNTYAVVINTGFTTHRGRIIRKIMNRTVKDPDIIRTTLVFVLEVVIVSMVTFFATLFLLIRIDIERIFIFFKFMDFLASSAPPSLPIFFNMAYSFSLARLGYKKIIGTEPQKTVDGAQVKTFCFDKTGTLTSSQVEINKVYLIENKPKLQFHNIIDQLGDSGNSLVWQLFSTCHTTKIINNELLGDEIDTQMFKTVNAQIHNTNDPNIRFIIRSSNQFENLKQQVQLGKQRESMSKIMSRRMKFKQMKTQQHLEVLKINQFESKFQSMSVLVRDVTQNRYYIFAKGSPEKLLSHSSNIGKDTQNSDIYMKMVKNLSLNGLRTIAMGYKQIKHFRQVEQYLKADREKYIENISTLGLIAFQNRLKNDTWLTIDRLVHSNIDPKMITGDNIYIAVETARRAGILRADEKVVFLEGRRNLRATITTVEGQKGQKEQFSRIFQGTTIEKLEVTESKIDNNFTEKLVQIHEHRDYLKGVYTFAVDNDFITGMSPAPLLSHAIKVFARIPPENKAFIIRQYKKQHNEYIRTHYSSFTRWLRTKKWKIGMCGDGANDLLALRQADLSIGIQATDASYGSSFTVSNMLDVDWVIKESKCTQANIINLYQYYASISMFVLITSIMLITDTTYFSTPQLMYLNFGCILLFPATLAMTRPSGESSPYVPDGNMMGLYNHLVFWGNLLIPYGGILGSWFYFYSSGEFVPNSKTTVTIANGGFSSKNTATSLMYPFVILTAACNALIMFTGRPWRQYFFKNYLFTVLAVGNLAVALAFVFLTAEIGSAMEFVGISRWRMGICLGIQAGALVLNFLYNLLIWFLELNHKAIILEKEESKLASLILRKSSKIKVRDSLIPN